MTLADLLHGPRYAVMARFGWEAQAAPLPGRLYTLDAAKRRIACLRRQPEFREARELRPVLLPTRRQRSRGPRITVGGAV